MNHSLLSYADAVEALKPMKISSVTLRRAASLNTPMRYRLKVVRFGHRTVGIRPVDLEKWKAQCAGEAI